MKLSIYTTVSALALLTAAPAFGQTYTGNQSTVSQSGNGNSANVDQTGGVEGVVIATQNGDGAQLTINQSEDPNGAGSYSVPSNKADVQQVNNNRTVPGVGSTATINQFSDNAGGQTNFVKLRQLTDGDTPAQNANISQSGSGNTADASQGILAGSPVNNTTNGQQLLSSQVGVGNSSISTQAGNNQSATVAQSGNTNDSTVNQSGNAGFAQANVTQSGDLNHSNVLQTSNGGTTATIIQTGTGNSSDSQQLGGAASADAFVTQNGDNNGSTLNQDLGAHNGQIHVTQTGSSNTSDVKQKDSTIVVPPYNSMLQATVTQTGNFNDSHVDQDATGAVANVNQSLDHNVSHVTQTGGSDAYVEQVGYRNDSTISQSGNSAAVGVYNDYAASVYQRGDDGKSILNQTGDGNSATVYQMEGSQFADSTVSQGGTNGHVFVQQGGIGNQSIVDQVSGDNNSANIYQTVTDSNYSSVTQAGNNNVANVHQ